MSKQLCKSDLSIMQDTSTNLVTIYHKGKPIYRMTGNAIFNKDQLCNIVEHFCNAEFSMMEAYA